MGATLCLTKVREHLFITDQKQAILLSNLDDLTFAEVAASAAAASQTLTFVTDYSIRANTHAIQHKSFQAQTKLQTRTQS